MVTGIGNLAQDDIVKALLAAHVHPVEPALQGVLLVRGGHQRVKGDLVDAQVLERLDVGSKSSATGRGS